MPREPPNPPTAPKKQRRKYDPSCKEHLQKAATDKHFSSYDPITHSMVIWPAPLDRDTGDMVSLGDMERFCNTYGIPFMLCLHGLPIRLFLTKSDGPGPLRNQWVGKCRLDGELHCGSTIRASAIVKTSTFPLIDYSREENSALRGPRGLGKMIVVHQSGPIVVPGQPAVAPQPSAPAEPQPAAAPIRLPHRVKPAPFPMPSPSPSPEPEPVAGPSSSQASSTRTDRPTNSIGALVRASIPAMPGIDAQQCRLYREAQDPHLLDPPETELSGILNVLDRWTMCFACVQGGEREDMDIRHFRCKGYTIDLTHDE